MLQIGASARTHQRRCGRESGKAQELLPDNRVDIVGELDVDADRLLADCGERRHDGITARAVDDRASRAARAADHAGCGDGRSDIDHSSYDLFSRNIPSERLYAVDAVLQGHHARMWRDKRSKARSRCLGVPHLHREYDEIDGSDFTRLLDRGHLGEMDVTERAGHLQAVAPYRL